MHPTQKSADAPGVTPTTDDIAAVKAKLAEYSANGRYVYAYGRLVSCVELLTSTTTAVRAETALLVATACIAAMRELHHDELTGFTSYTREDPEDPTFVLPEGIEGFALGRWAR